MSHLDLPDGRGEHDMVPLQTACLYGSALYISGEEFNPGNLKNSLTPENSVKRPVCSMKSSGAGAIGSGETPAKTPPRTLNSIL